MRMRKLTLKDQRSPLMNNALPVAGAAQSAHGFALVQAWRPIPDLEDQRRGGRIPEPQVLVASA